MMFDWEALFAIALTLLVPGAGCFAVYVLTKIGG